MTSAATGQVRILWKDSGTGNKTAVVYLVEPSGSGGTADTCVRVATWVACDETGSLVQSFKWLMLPSAWVFDEPPSEDCPPAETEV